MLFARGDSITNAELVPCCTRALRLDPTVRDSIPHFMLMIDKIRKHAEDFDVLHFHIDLFHFPLAGSSDCDHASRSACRTKTAGRNGTSILILNSNTTHTAMAYSSLEWPQWRFCWQIRRKAR
jgi:hypothetical protein